MLLTDFYTLTDFQQGDGNSYSASIRLNKEHDIFKGHFPGNPVTPGVCMMQIIKELVEKVTAQKLFMFKSSNVKFMALINPEINPELQLSLDITKDEAGFYKVKNSTSFGDTVALKLVCTYKVR